MDLSSPLKSTKIFHDEEEDSNTKQSVISAFITRNQNLSIFIAIFLLIMISVIVSLIFTQYKANPCAPFSRVMIEKTIFGGSSYSVLQNMTTKFGHRYTGSAALENSIDWVKNEMIKAGLSNVKKESVSIPIWRRNAESCTMLNPYFKNIGLLGLGNSVGMNISAEAIVVSSFADLETRKTEVTGKIVVFNQPWTGYDSTVQYRHFGADIASSYGAVGCLVRSVAPTSMYTPHTGSVRYNGTSIKIPVAEITIEDASLLSLIQKSGEKIFINLNLGAQILLNSTSYNVMGEITGETFPEQVIVIGTQMDSWDVGQGALYGAGMAMLLDTIRVVTQLNVKPQRTLRIVGWTDTVNGNGGAEAYAKAHGNETHLVLAINGMFGPPTGFKAIYEPNDNYINAHFLNSILPLLKHIGTRDMKHDDTLPEHVPLLAPFWEQKIAGISVDLVGNNDLYYSYQNSNADVIDLIKPTDMNFGAAAIIVMGYCVADA